MDKELLRVIIIAIGLLVIAGMVLWSYIKNRNEDQPGRVLWGAGFKDKARPKSPAQQPPSQQNDADDFTVVPQKAAAFDEPAHLDEEVDQPELEDTIGYADDENDTAPRFIVPDIIQFSIMAKANQTWNGIDLANAFNIVGLIYGTLKIYERLDDHRLVDFGVASMARPGTFPNPDSDDSDIASYTCPGLVLFMQPNVLDNPQAVFDDFVDTLRLLAVELDGEMSDHEGNPLTDETIQLFRQSL